MRIAIDLDDVIIDTTPAWLAAYNARTGEGVKYEQLTDWNFGKFVKKPDLFYSLLYPPYDLYYAAEVPGAKQAVDQLMKAGHEIVYITASFHEGKGYWLKERGFIDSFYPVDPRLIIASNKSLINAAMLIDDKAESVIRYPNGGVIFARPWNDTGVWPVNVQRLNDWSEIINYVEGLSNARV